VRRKLRKLNGLLRLSDGTRAAGRSLDASLYSARWHSTDQAPLALIQSGQLGRYSALDPSDGGDTGRAILGGEWHRQDEDGYFAASAYVQHYQLQLWSNFTFFEYWPASGDQFEQEEHRNIVGGQWVRGRNHLLVGKDSVPEVGLQIRHNQIRVGLPDTQQRVAFQTVSDDAVNQTQIGIHVENTTTWQPWSRSRIALRQDIIEMRMSSLTVAQNSGSAAGAELLPKLSLILGPWRKTEFFFNVGKGFHSNDVRGVIGKIDSTTGLRSSPVPALACSPGAEIGLRSDFINRLQTSLALWRLDSDSELVYNADSAIGSTSPSGASRRYGLEWNNHMVVDRWLLLDADLSWIRARYAASNDNGQPGNHVPYAVGKLRYSPRRLGAALRRHEASIDALCLPGVRPGGPWRMRQRRLRHRAHCFGEGDAREEGHQRRGGPTQERAAEESECGRGPLSPGQVLARKRRPGGRADRTAQGTVFACT